MEIPDIQIDSVNEQDEGSKAKDLIELAEDSKYEDLKEKSNDETPQINNEIPQSSDEIPQKINEIPQMISEIPQSSDEIPQINEIPQSSDEIPQINEIPQSSDEIPQSKDESEVPQSMDETPQSKDESRDEAPQSTDETPQSKDENKSEAPQSIDETPQSKDESKGEVPRSMGETPQIREYPFPRLSEKSFIRSSLHQRSSFLSAQPSSISPQLFSLSSASRMEDLLEPPTESESETVLETSDIPSDFGAFSSSTWQETEWTRDIPICHAPVFKRTFHDSCYRSVIDQMIEHSPESCTKAPFRRCFKKQQASKRKQICFQKYPASVVKKTEHKLSSQLQQPPTTSSFSFKGSDRCSGRRSKALYNLYTTFCDEGETFGGSFIGDKGSLFTSGLTRACTIFCYIKNGKINADNLLLTLHMLGILITAAELKKVLALIAVDAQGNLEFADFLCAVNKGLPFSETRAFSTPLRIAQEIFKKVKKEMVVIEELEPTLAALGVTLSSKVMERALKRIRITWDGKVNIADFLLTVNGPLSSHSRIASINECATLKRRSIQGPSELKILEKEIRPHASVTFYDADQEFALNQVPRDPTEFQRSSVEIKRPTTAPLPCPDEEEKDKYKGRPLEWPKVTPTFGYSSQDTLFPISTSLLSKEDVWKGGSRNMSWGSDQDFIPLSTAQMRMRYAALTQKKKKRLSFQEDFPKRYAPEDNEKQKSETGSTKSEGKEGSGGLSVELFSEGGF